MRYLYYITGMAHTKQEGTMSNIATSIEQSIANMNRMLLSACDELIKLDEVIYSDSYRREDCTPDDTIQQFMNSLTETQKIHFLKVESDIVARVISDIEENGCSLIDCKMKCGGCHGRTVQ